MGDLDDIDEAPASAYADALPAFKEAGFGRARQVLAEVTKRMKETKVYPDTITYPLSKPIQGPEGELHELVLRDPDAALLNGLGITGADTKNALAESMVLIARVANVPPSTIKRIKLRDLGEIGEILDFFTGSGPKIGDS